MKNIENPKTSSSLINASLVLAIGCVGFVIFRQVFYLFVGITLFSLILAK